MRKTFFDGAMALSVVSVLSVGLPSCVNADYELSEEKLDLNVTLFQEGLALPLGSTENIYISEFISRAGDDIRQYLDTLENGAFALGIAGTFDVSDRLSELSGFGSLDAMEWQKDFSFNIRNVDIGGFSIEGRTLEGGSVDIAGKAGFKLPELSPVELRKSISQCIPTMAPGSLDVSLGEDVSHQADIFTATRIDPVAGVVDEDTEYEFSELSTLLGSINQSVPALELSFAPTTESVSLSEISLPEGIKSVNSIELNENAALKVTIAIENSIFTDGELSPEIDVDLHELFHLSHDGEYGDEVIDSSDELEEHVKANFSLNAEGGWTDTHIYGIESLAVTPDDWTGSPLTLNKEIELTFAGRLVENESDPLKTTVAKINELADKGEGENTVRFHVTLEFVDLTIENVNMTLEPVEFDVTEQQPVNFNFSLPEEFVESVEYVTFDRNNPLSIDLSASIPEELASLALTLETLTLDFPDSFEFASTAAEAVTFNEADKSFTYTGVNLGTIKDNIVLDRMNLPSPVGGAVSINDCIKVTARAVAGGNIDSRNIISDEVKELEVKVDANVDFAPAITDYKVNTKAYHYEVEVDPYEFSQPVDKTVADLSPVKVLLEKTGGGQQPVIRLDFNYPDYEGCPLRILPDEQQGLRINLPQMLVFAEQDRLEREYNYDGSSISFSAGQVIPHEIVLPIAHVLVAPVEKEGGYVVEGAFSVEGGVCVAPVSMTKSDVDGLVENQAYVSFSGNIPDIVPATLEVGEYATPVEEEFAVEMPDLNSLPEMLVSVGEVELDEVYLDLSVDASDIRNLVGNGAGVALDFAVSLPDMIKIAGEDGKDAEGTVKVSGTLDEKGRIVIDPLRIRAIDLSGVDLKAEDALAGCVIRVDGQVRITDASIGADAIENADVKVLLDASIKSTSSEDGGIRIAKVTGKVDCQLEPVTQKIDLTAITDLLGSDNVSATLDLNRFYLTLDLATNLGVPANAHLTILPYKGSSVLEHLRADEQLTLKCSQNPSDIVHTRYWISNETQCPEDYVHLDVKLLEMLRELPDSLVISVTAGTDAGKDCVFAPSAEYRLQADYRLDVPVEFGEEFRFEYCDTIAGMPSELGQILSHGSLALTGDVTSCIPLQLDLKVELLDTDGVPVALADGAGHQKIKPCGIDGSPVTSELNILMGIRKDAVIPEISALRLVFTATSEGASGAPLTESAFVQANIRALIPEGGISVDLKELGGEMAEDDEEDNM